MLRQSDHTVAWGDREIPYTLIFSRRRRHLGITVHPDLRVTVRAPAGAVTERIADEVRGHAQWIARHLERFERLPPRPIARQFTAGALHLHLGEEYPLEIERGPAGVTLSSDRLLVRLPRTPTPRTIEAALRRWYLGQARDVIPQRLERLRLDTPRFARFAVTVRLRWMRRRWGSCHPSGRITLNAELMKVAPACIDFIVMHELCHLLVPNHSPRFYDLLTSCMPDWKRHRAQLRATYL